MDYSKTHQGVFRATIAEAGRFAGCACQIDITKQG